MPVKNREAVGGLDVMVAGNLLIDRKKQQVSQDGRLIELPGLSFRLLDCLARHWPETVSRRDVRREVWGETLVSDDTVHQRVRLLRKALGRADVVTSVKGVGYRLNGERHPGGLAQRNHNRSARIAWGVAALLVVAVIAAAPWDGAHSLKHLLRHGFPWVE